jgi:hypothetical protein
MFKGISLRIAEGAAEKKDYATSSLQKGLLILHNGDNLAMEAVGFGLPVVKRGLKTIFPGSVKLALSQNGPVWRITASYLLNLEEKISRAGSKKVRNNLIYSVKNALAALIREFPPARRLLTAVSSGLRRIFRLETIYEEAGYSANIEMTYIIDAPKGRLRVEMDASKLSDDEITEVIVMNEQGARHFDEYRDSSGLLLRGDGIGCWNEVKAERASFVSADCRLQYTLNRIEGATLFRGRELIGSRLAWSGFGYSFLPAIKKASYNLLIENLQ